LRFSGKEDVANFAEKSRRFRERNMERGNSGGRGSKFETEQPMRSVTKYFPAERDSLFERNLNFKAAKFFGVVDRRESYEMNTPKPG